MADNQLSSITFVGIDSEGYISAVNTVHHNETDRELLYQQSILHTNSGEIDEDIGYLDNANTNKLFCSTLFSGHQRVNDDEEQSQAGLSMHRQKPLTELVIYSAR
ncbi:hypothetical protein QRZ34_28635 [Klebsiella michiganensis]|jgi:hypothetical protein|uniref:hypothetical protein n=1 Tax=Klebsiella michiganensis TaxID=1134687 RepID=UPI00256FD855|nr:hypothetical protein [Klebsiella michiganensis]MDL4454960.1 hypothetical protein [Klebsiella michiganensis]